MQTMVRAMGVCAIIGVILGVLVGYGGQTETKKVLSYRDSLEDAIANFEKSREKTVTAVTAATEDALGSLQKKRPDLPGASETWETEWRAAHAAFRQLEEDFSGVAKTSREFFLRLEKLTAEIRDAGIKAAEEAKDRRLRAAWTGAFAEAAAHLDKLRGLLADGDDFSRVLLAAAVRESLEVNITELRRISERAQAMLVQLERLTLEGRRLVGRG